MGIYIGIGNTIGRKSGSRNWTPRKLATNLAVSVVSATALDVTWTDPVQEVDRLEVMVSTDNVNFTSGSIIAYGVQVCHLTGLTSGLDYYIQIRSIVDYVAPAVAPVVVSRIVNNATPTLLEITFDLALNETLIPATPAFTVTHNTVTNVAISGTKVTLTLGTALIFFDKEYVSYTVPGSNPITSLTGVAATSFATQSITNNVAIVGTGYGWYKPKESGAVVKKGTGDAVWYDMIQGSAARGTELATGSTVIGNVYEVTRTQDDFINGLIEGMVYCETNTRTLNATNKVKLVLGNPVGQFNSAKMPINGLLDGVDDRAKGGSGINQPVFIFMLLKQKGWVANAVIFSGASPGAGLYQHGTSPKVYAYGGTSTSADMAGLVLNEYHIVRVLLKGASSKVIVDDGTPVTGSWGTSNLGSISFGAATSTESAFANYELAEAIVMADPDSTYETAIYNHLLKNPVL